MTLTREQVERTVRQRYGEGQRFQSREVREKLGILGSDRDGISRLHNYLKAMEKDGVIQKIPSDQKRNQFFRLSVVEAQIPPTSGRVVLKETTPKMPQTVSDRPIDRLGRMEDTLLAMQQRLSSIENKLDKALMVWL
ncbi:MAG TPA: hypothetical protein VIA62_05795 [Thermoanaerobaculia bacterium]|jgi:hypothetical protein|nr:hypothetical protein [Thermoanaerobaculia bacterium]